MLFLGNMLWPQAPGMMRQSSDKVLLLGAHRLKRLGLDGTDRAYEQWMRANNNQQPLQSN
jgi:hypothetical protein